MIKIVTDSFSALCRQDLENSDLNFLLATCNLDGKTFPDSHDFQYDVLNIHHSYSTSPSATEYYNTFSKILMNGDDILCITASSQICSAYSNAKIAAKAAGAIYFGNTEGNEKIYVLNSNTVAGGQLLAIFKAKQLIEAGIDLKGIAFELEAFCGKIKTFFTTAKFDNPIFDKRIHRRDHFSPSPILGKRSCFTMDNGCIRYLGTIKYGYTEVKKISEEFDNPAQIVVNYSDDLNYIDSVYEYLNNFFPHANIIKRKIPLSLLIHLRNETLGISAAE